MTTDWYNLALCAGMNDDTFFPDQEDHEQRRMAKKICGSAEHPRCPVREQCEAHARQHGEKFGIWGGKSTYTRRAPRKYLGGGMG